MISCIAIDDEPLALDVIRDFCDKISFLELKTCCSNAVEAMELIAKENIDLIFVDIQMPNLTGLDFIKTLKNSHMVIFTTAYPQHALEGFELNAVDYLLKPIPFERFLQAVNKVYELFTLKQKAADGSFDQEPHDFIIIKVGHGIVRVDIDSIQYIEGLKDYVKICTPQKTYLTKSTMKNMVEKLPSKKFYRVHKSYIVSVKRMRRIEQHTIEIADKTIPIGEVYRDGFYDFIEQYKL